MEQYVLNRYNTIDILQPDSDIVQHALSMARLTACTVVLKKKVKRKQIILFRRTYGEEITNYLL